MSPYRALLHVPPLVQRALNLAEQMEYAHSCSHEVGRLLQLFASQFQSGVIGELCAGCGVSAAWIASALSPATSFITVEPDPARAAATRALLYDFPNVRIYQGDWHAVLRVGNYGLLFAGGPVELGGDSENLLQALRRGGLLVIDRLTPGGQMPLGRPKGRDALRSFWLNDARLLASEIQVSPSEAALLATRSE